MSDVRTIRLVHPTPSATPLTLLIVDDQPSVLMTLRFVLGDRYRVVSAGSGSEALALATEHAIDGAIIDVHMPAMGGLETCERLRAQAASAGRSLPVWLMSAAATAEVRRRALEVGVVGFFEKPFPPDLLGRLAAGLSAASLMAASAGASNRAP